MVTVDERTPRCEYCGRFANPYMTFQPETDIWKLEPEEPIVLCVLCHAKAVVNLVDPKEERD